METFCIFRARAGDKTSKKLVISDEFKVTRFRRYLPKDKTRKKALIQFYAREGGLRTVAEGDLIQIR